MTIGLRAAPESPPGRPDRDGCVEEVEDEGPGVTFPAVGVPDFDTGGVDFPLSLGGLLDPGVEAWLLTSLRGLRGPL